MACPWKQECAVPGSFHAPMLIDTISIRQFTSRRVRSSIGDAAGVLIFAQTQYASPAAGRNKRCRLLLFGRLCPGDYTHSGHTHTRVRGLNFLTPHWHCLIDHLRLFARRRRSRAALAQTRIMCTQEIVQDHGERIRVVERGSERKVHVPSQLHPRGIDIT